MELEAQRKDEERQEDEEVSEEPKRFTAQEIARGSSLLEEARGGMISFWDSGPECKTVRELCSSCSEGNSVLLYHLWWEKKKELPPIKRIDRIESSTEPDPVPSASGMSEIAVCPPSPVPMVLQLYHLPPPLLPPVSNSSCFFTWSQPLYAICCTVLLYFSRHCTVVLYN